ncbi:MAG: Fe-S cluster assembly protein SufD, partial [Bacteroidaceae bacterium]
MNSEKQYIELYGQTKQFIDAGSHVLINAHRQQALAQLEAQGLPTSKNERYKYINVAEAFAPDYGLNIKRMKIETDPRVAYRCSVPNLDSMLYYVYNDKVVAKDDYACDAERLFVGSLVDFAANRPEEFKKYYNKLTGDGLVALNTLLAQDGVVVWIGDGYKCEKTIQILNLTLGNVAMMTNRRVMVVVGKGAEASLLVCD